MNKYVSLNREESGAIKGLLIFLIILGHNAIFTQSLSGAFEYLYMFHVQVFFIIPFMYKTTKSISYSDSIRKNFVRLYYPFILFFLFLSLLFFISNGSNVDLNKLNIAYDSDSDLYYFINTLITGNFYLIDYFAGFQYLWFLPVMFSMSVIKDVANNKKHLSILLSIVGLFCYLMFFVFLYKTPYDRNINFLIMQFSPFALLQGIGAFFLGNISLLIMNNKHIKYINIICSIIFIVMSIIYIVKINNNTFDRCDLWVYRFFMPLLFINFIYYLREHIAKSEILKKIGEYSFPIFLIHPPLCAIAYIICNKFFEINIMYGIFIQLFVTYISYCLSVLWYKITPLRKKTLPRSLEELYK